MRYGNAATQALLIGSPSLREMRYQNRETQNRAISRTFSRRCER